MTLCCKFVLSILDAREERERGLAEEAKLISPRNTEAHPFKRPVPAP